MIDYGRLLRSIDKLYHESKQPELVSAPSSFPVGFENAYAGQPEAIQQLVDSNEILLSSHTGSGKTLVFLAASKEKKLPTLVIEPKKFLQAQVSKYYDDFPIYGKSHYPCHYANTAADAPCVLKYRDKDTKQIVFEIVHDNEEVEKIKYPCEKCAYLDAKNEAFRNLRNNDKIVISNFGNFRMFLKDTRIVIIDEADAFFKSISSATKIENVRLQKTVLETINHELKNVNIEIENITQNISSLYKQKGVKIIRKYNRLISASEKLSFFKNWHQMCFQYIIVNKNTNWHEQYVELNPKYVNLMKDKIFQDKILYTVTATPSDFNCKNIVNYSIPQRTRIFYTPIGLMTSRNISMGDNYRLLENAADFMKTMQSIFEAKYNSKKAIIHCGNLKSHAKRLLEHLPEDQCLVHSSGRLFETVEEFRTSDKRFLVVVAAEYGLDIPDVNYQFVLKIPYQAMDARIRELERQMSEADFKSWYTMDALNRLIQQSGRVGRGANTFGCTFILDMKFRSLYLKYIRSMPHWFLERLDPTVY